MTAIQRVIIGVFGKKADQPTAEVTANGADFSLDAYADLETGARLIGIRASQQLKAIVQRRQAS